MSSNEKMGEKESDLEILYADPLSNIRKREIKVCVPDE